MRHTLRIARLHALIFMLVAGAAVIATAPAAAQGKHWVCIRCGLPCDAKVFDRPGTCPDCGMALVEQGAVQTISGSRMKVAILLFNGVEIIDYAAPYELFGAADYDVYTVAATREPLTTAMGMTVVPRCTFADAPQPDVLVVPGGGVHAAQKDSRLLKYVIDTSSRSKHTMSVCNGAFILASAGLLDGLTATTTYGNAMRLHTDFPKVRVVGDRRYVDNGRIITTAGLSAGMDGALHVISLMSGEKSAKEVALEEEYDWHPGGGYARPSMADRFIPNIDLKKEVEAAGEWKLVRSEGNADRWEVDVQGDSRLDGPAIVHRVGRALETQAKWVSVSTEAGMGASREPASAGAWKFKDLDGKAWRGALTVEALPGAGGQYMAKLTIARAD